MTTRIPKRICSYPSCKNIATSKGRCELHQYTQDKKESRRSTTKNNDVYNSTKWRKLRAKKAKQNPLCEDCLRYNIYKPLDVVDHIKPILDYPELTYTYSNLRSLCHLHHNQKTAKETADRTKPKTITANDLFNQIANRGNKL